MNKFFKKVLFYNNYGYMYLILNIAYTIFPLIISIVNTSNTWIVTLTLLIIYMISYILTYISEEQNKKLNNQSYPQFTFKAFNFIFSSLAILIYAAASYFVSIPFGKFYILSNCLISFLVLYWMILSENTDNIDSSRQKLKIYWQRFKEIVIGDKTNSLKGLFKGVIFSVCILCFVLIVVFINIYKFDSRLEVFKHYIFK